MSLNQNLNQNSINRTTFIYENDFKFNKFKNINTSSTKIEFQSDDLKVKSTIDYDSIESRLLECKKNKSTSIDLSSMKINKESILNLPIDYSKIIFLFLNDNNLDGELDLRKFNNLEVLDIENNSLTNIILPSCMKELVINNNKLNNLPSNINPLRLKASNNLLSFIPDTYTNIEIMELSYNMINKVNKLDNLRKLIIDSNPLESIKTMEKLLYLDISDIKTDNIKIDSMPNLLSFVANSTKLQEIPFFKTLETIEVINTPIKKLQFFPKFNIILCSYSLTKNISSKYVDLTNAHIKIKHNNILCITRDNIE